MGRYRKDSITLSVQVPKQTAVLLLGRLWATGIITEEQYKTKMAKVDADYLIKEQRKHKKLEMLLKRGTK